LTQLQVLRQFLMVSRLMQSPLFLLPANDKQNEPLTLHRYPVQQQNRSLQAWDSADELILNHLAQEHIIKTDSKIVVINDNFGALTVPLSMCEISCWSDSYVAELAIRQNLLENDLEENHINFIKSTDTIPENVDIVLLKLPKTKALLVEQLIAIKNSQSENTIVIAADKAKNIQTATLKLFEKYLGTTKTSLAVKKSRLIFATLDNQESHQQPAPLVWKQDDSDFELSHLSNVFGREKLDIGARLFLQHLPKIKPGKQIIDLGCGNGVIGLNTLAANPECQLTFVDESYMAVESAQLNVANNLPDLLAQAHFSVDDCLTEQDSNTADVILCNPPFHQQNAVTDHIAWQMFKDSYRVLKKAGELRIVGNRQLGYHIKLKRIFGNCKTIASNRKFVILSAIKK